MDGQYSGLTHKEDKKLSILDRFRKMWYGDTEVYPYNSDDYGGLWEGEEQDELSSSPIKRSGSDKLDKKEAVFNQVKFRGTTNVIQHPTLTQQSEVVVIEPRSFEESLDIVEELRCRRSVILNLQYLDTEQSQRVVDFLSGATHALDGHQQRVGQGVFIFAPNNFTISTESQEARALKDAFYGRNAENEKEPVLQFTEPVAKKSSIF